MPSLTETIGLARMEQEKVKMMLSAASAASAIGRPAQAAAIGSQAAQQASVGEKLIMKVASAGQAAFADEAAEIMRPKRSPLPWLIGGVVGLVGLGILWRRSRSSKKRKK